MIYISVILKLWKLILWCLFLITFWKMQTIIFCILPTSSKVVDMWRCWLLNNSCFESIFLCVKWQFMIFLSIPWWWGKGSIRPQLDSFNYWIIISWGWIMIFCTKVLWLLIYTYVGCSQPHSIFKTNRKILLLLLL